ncbi:hypothetical protein [Paenibacillus alvei]|uniref:hypothetical protein n=1 Tax=Paenibacillus TaxID=44249 RepID=UPI001580A23A|nr:hypothetical protein [Paenibacillus alvei]
MRVKTSFFSVSAILLVVVFVLIGCSGSPSKGEGWVSTNFSQQETDNLQKQVDEGHKPGLTDWQQVSREYLNTQEGLVVNEDIDVKLIVDEKAKKVVQYTLKDGRSIQLELIQPSKEGPSGIFVVSRYRFASNE